MSDDYSDKSCLIVDNGLFVGLAVKMAKSFGLVRYYSTWEGEYPKSSEIIVGEGIPGVERCNDIWSCLNDTDLFIFPDIYFGGMQRHLEDLGHRVWGSRRGEELELFRLKSKQHMENLGIPIGPYEVVHGSEELRDYLREHDNVFVKISRTRGDVETFFSKNYAYIESRLDRMEAEMGPSKHTKEFLIETPIKNAVEIGYDGPNCDGQTPEIAMVGIEIKDKAYVGHFLPKAKWPEQITSAHELLAPTLEKYHYRNWLSLETRITKDGTGYVVDPCCRFGSPPGASVIYSHENLDDIFWYGAEGEVVDPVPKGQWAVEVMIHSQWIEKYELNVQFPKKIKEHIVLKNLAMQDGKYYVVPKGYPSGVGSVVSAGDDLQTVIKEVQDLCEEVEACDLDLFPEALDDAQDEIDKLKQYGIKL